MSIVTVGAIAGDFEESAGVGGLCNFRGGNLQDISVVRQVRPHLLPEVVLVVVGQKGCHNF